jgi:hypothetical protein
MGGQMKRFLVLLSLVLTVILLGCSPSAKSENYTATDNLQRVPLKFVELSHDQSSGKITCQFTPVIHFSGTLTYSIKLTANSGTGIVTQDEHTLSFSNMNPQTVVFKFSPSMQLDALGFTGLINEGAPDNILPSNLTDADLIALAQLAAENSPQPEAYTSCLLYAQARGLSVTASGNTGAFNLLYLVNDAKLVNNSPTNQLRPEIKPLQNLPDLTKVLEDGDYIVWQRGVAGSDPNYGHIAKVELVATDRVVISQAGWTPAWKVLHTSDFVPGIYGYPMVGLH